MFVLRRKRFRLLREELDRVRAENAVMDQLLAAQREWVSSRQAEDGLRGVRARNEAKQYLPPG